MSAAARTPAGTERLTRRGSRLASFTVAYNEVEGAVAITVGGLAGLVSMVGFGVDSGIESESAMLVGLRLTTRLRLTARLRLTTRLRHGHADEAKERRAVRAVAVNFSVLAG